MSRLLPVTGPTRLGLAALAVLCGVAAPLAVTSAADAAPTCPLPGVCFGTISATTDVAIAATPAPKVGNTISATPPVWDDASATTTYQWQRDGADISGATAQTYAPVAADVMHQLTVVASASDGAATGTSTSAAVTGVIGDPRKPSSPMQVTGSPSVGSVLTVVPGKWGADPQPSFSFQWYRSNGQTAPKLEGETGSTYTVATDDIGRKVVAVVTATQPGYTTGAAASQIVSVPRTVSRTGLNIVNRKVYKGDHPRVRVSVKLADKSTPAGKVVVRDGSTVLHTYTIAVKDDGALRLVLPVLKPGKHQLKASYLGDATRAPSASGTVSITVLTTHAPKPKPKP